ncbi:MAG: hypothetical protein KatS3mg121_1232 [Gammaproteobacteria bacterium]|nr:MAG: hypothetical protein KatS3mg121_1232 [Gammaproteobacteria bacterium]
MWERRLRLLAAPLRAVPVTVHSTVLAAVLNDALRSLRAGGALDFLEGRVVALMVEDAGLSCRLVYRRGRFAAAPAAASPAVTVCAGTATFIGLAARRLDYDSAFFARRLRIFGDTALGMRLRNVLDGVGELPPPWRGVQGLLQRLAEHLAPGRAGA